MTAKLSNESSDHILAIFNSKGNNLETINYDKMHFSHIYHQENTDFLNLSHLIIHFCDNKFENVPHFLQFSKYEILCSL